MFRQLPVQGFASATDACCSETVDGEGPSDGSKDINAILQLVKNMCAEVEDRCTQKYGAMLTAKDAELATKSREWAQQRSELLTNVESKQSKLEQYRKEVSQLQSQLHLAETKCTELTAEIANTATKQSTVISTMQSDYEKMKERNANFIKERDHMKQYVEYLKKKRQESDEEWGNSAKAVQRTKLAFEEATKEWKIEKAALEHRIGTLRSNEQIYFDTIEVLRRRNSKLDEAKARFDNTVAKLLALAETSADQEMKKKAAAIVAASPPMVDNTSQPGMATQTTGLLDSGE
ncbi:hypothetical protein AAVH_35852 [Aphelenchoides avenae]|nr:hypothetical protein AAVH_35852 [Aphelenchus avenae]